MANPTAIGLIRVSTADQALGLEAQRADIARFAVERGIDVLSIVTEIISGGAPFDGRHGLREAIGLVAQHCANHLIVAKRDRFSREPLVSILAEQALGRIGASLLAVDGNNEVGPAAKLLRHILDGVACFEREMIGVRTKAALAALRSQGKTLGRPIGIRGRTRSDKGIPRGPRGLRAINRPPSISTDDRGKMPHLCHP